MEKELKKDFGDIIKIVLFGPESTGKTTLAAQLALHYKTDYVPEFSRTFAELKEKNEESLTAQDVLTITKGQIELENEYIKKGNSLIICDTDVLETMVYSELYYPDLSFPILEKYAEKHTGDLYFLTYIDTPWKEDSVRDRPHNRDKDFKAFEAILAAYNKPYVLLKGTENLRFETAVKHIDELIKNKS